MEPTVISSPTILQEAGRIAFHQQRVSDMPSAEPCVSREVIPESTLAARLAPGGGSAPRSTLAPGLEPVGHLLYQ